MSSGTLKRSGDKYVLRFERRLRHPPEKVWRALSEPDELAHWFPARMEGERREGASIRFVFEGHEGPTLTGTLRVFDPPRVLEYSWDDELLRWELTPHAEGCLLVFTTTFAERVKAPRDAAGWDLCLDGLEGTLDANTPRAATRAPREWTTLYRGYAASFGASDFPLFVRRGGEPVADPLGTPGVEGVRFRGEDGTSITLCRATRDAESAEHEPIAETYVLVLDGSYVIHLNGQDLSLAAGGELMLPQGLAVRARVTAGTRLLFSSEGAAR